MYEPSNCSLFKKPYSRYSSGCNKEPSTVEAKIWCLILIVLNNSSKLEIQILATLRIAIYRARALVCWAFCVPQLGLLLQSFHLQASKEISAEREARNTTPPIQKTFVSYIYSPLWSPLVYLPQESWLCRQSRSSVVNISVFSIGKPLNLNKLFSRTACTWVIIYLFIGFRRPPPDSKTRLGSSQNQIENRIKAQCHTNKQMASLCPAEGTE